MEREELVQPDEDTTDRYGAVHKKFTNYRFDRHEFVRIVGEMADEVLAHNKYKRFVSGSGGEGTRRDEL